MLMKIMLTSVLVSITCRGAHAQLAPPVPRTQAVEIAATPPFVDPGQEIRGLALVKALRGGGFVLFMRHAFAGPPKPPCPNEAALTAEGEDQARQVGVALRELKVPIASIKASETCRTFDTAKLLDLGQVATNADLNPATTRRPVSEYAEQFKYLLESPPLGSNLLLVSHVQGSAKLEERILIDYAEIVVYRPDSSGKAQPVARVPLVAWAGLVAAAAADPAK